MIWKRYVLRVSFNLRNKIADSFYKNHVDWYLLDSKCLLFYWHKWSLLFLFCLIITEIFGHQYHLNWSFFFRNKHGLSSVGLIYFQFLR